MNNQIMNVARMFSGGNPQEIAMNLLRQNSVNNPVLQNALRMAENGDHKGIEQLARNLCQEKNVNPDEMIQQIRSFIGK